MDISYFKEFVILAETQNFWAAAERLFIGQSSLSKHIKSLETQLGAPLFNRTSRKVTLTEFGARMLPYAQAIAKLQYEYETDAFNYLHEGKETLEIGSIPAMAQYDITNLLVHFQTDYPAVRIHTQEADTTILREWLLERKCELAFLRDSVVDLTFDPAQENRLVKVPFCQDHLVAVLQKEHPLAGRDSVELAQLKDEPFVLLSKDTVPYTLCMRACRDAGFVPRVLFTSHSLENVLDMVTQGSCVVLLFSRHVKYPIDSVLSIAPPFAVVPIAPEVQSTLYLSYLKDSPLSPAAEHFIDYCMLSAHSEWGSASQPE